MAKRYRDSTRARRVCFDTHKFEDHLGRIRLKCHLHGCIIDPTRDAWRADHIVHWANGGEDTPENLFPICTKCDVEEKAPDDTRKIAKGKRVRDKHFKIEVKRKKQWKPEGAKFNWASGRYERQEADE